MNTFAFAFNQRPVVNAILIAAALGTLSATVSAGERSLPLAAIHWTAASAACADEATVKRAVERQLGRRVFASDEHADVHLYGDVALGRDDRWHASLVTRTKEGGVVGSRAITSATSDCSSLDASVTLLVALAVSPQVERSAPAPALPTIERPVQSAPKIRKASWEGAARLGGGVAVGLLPAFAPGVIAGIEVRPPHFFPIDLSAPLWPSGDSSGSSGGRFLIGGATLSVCPGTAVAPRLRVALCGGVGVGAIWGRGVGFDANRDATKPFGTVDVGGRAEIELAGPVFVAVALRAIVPFVRPQFVVDDGGGRRQTIFAMSPLSGALDLQTGVRFR